MTKDTAVTAYVDRDEWATVELGWLHRSWIYSGSIERSDMVLFYNPIVDIAKLPSGDGVILIPLAPVCDSDPMWHDYRRINSTWFLTTPEAEILHKYKYTLKTDTDCFLTKNFVTWKPRLATFGVNMYATIDPNVGLKISQICNKWGVKEWHKNVEANCMAYSTYVTEYAKLQYHIAKKLKVEEFNDGHGEWPGWYEYIINMYSAGIAANKFFGSGYMIGGLGVHSMCQDAMGTTDFHIHAYHTYQHFSKIKWREGEYDCIDHDALDDEIVANYCIKIAGKRFV